MLCDSITLTILFLNVYSKKMDEETMERCDNCLKEYPESKMATHFGYCRRNIKKCPTCHEMYDINFQEEHDQQFHKQDDCPYCQRSFPSAQLKAHESKCTKKPKYCEYCDLNVPVETFPVHLKECQARTKPCTKCNRPITNKQYLVHLVSCEGYKQQPKIVQPPPPRTYQEHIQYQRRVIEPSSQTLVNNKSKDKVKPSYQYRGRQEKHYAPIVNERNEGKGFTYQPPRQQVRAEVRQEVRYGLRQQPKKQQKRQSEKYIPNRGEPRREQPKREEPKKYITSINPPSSSTSNSNKYTSNSYKREEARVIRPNQPQRQPGVYDYRGVGSRQAKNGAIKDTGSSKNIYTSSSNAPKTRTYGTQQTKETSDKYGVKRSTQQYKPTQPITKAPEVKTRVIYQTRTQQPQHQSHVPQNQADFLHQQYALGALDLNGQDHELQMAIMQSMGGSSNKNSSYTFENQWSNPSFVAQQKQIEQELKKNKQRR